MGDVILEDLPIHLNQDEEVLWYFEKYYNLNRERLSNKIGYSIVQSLFIGLIITFTVPLIYIAILESDIDFLLMTILLILPLDIYFLYLMERIRKGFQIDNKNLNDYQSDFKLNEENSTRIRSFFILTNERWLEKNIDIERYKYAKELGLDINRGVISINLQNIEMWYIFDRRIFLYPEVDNFKEKKHHLKFGAIVPKRLTLSITNLLYRLPQFIRKDGKYVEIRFYKRNSL